MAASCPPHIFSWKSQLLDFPLGIKRTHPQLHEIYPQNLLQISIPLVVRGSKKQQRREQDFFKFHKRTDSFSLLKNVSVIGLISPCTPPCSSQKRSFSPLQFGQEEDTHLKGELSDLFSPLYPQTEQKEDDGSLANYLCIYVSRTIPTAENSASCRE